MARTKHDAPAEPGTINVPISEIVGLKEELSVMLSHLHTGLLTLQNAAHDSHRLVNMTSNRLLANAGISVADLGLAPLAPIISNIPSFPVPPPAAAPAVEVVAIDAKQKRQKREKKIKDPLAPPRPVTAYFLFLKEKRQDIKAELGENAAPGEVQAKATERWKALPEKEQEKYKVRYKENWIKYAKALEAYKAQGGQVSAEALTIDESEIPDAGSAAAADPVPEARPTPAGKKAKEPKKAKGATPAKTPAASAAAPAATAAAAKEKSPEKKKKAAAATTAAEDNKKKRKSDAAADKPEKKKKRKSDA